VNLAPESAKMAPVSGAETKSSLMPKSPGAPLPAVQTGLPAASADLLPKIPDTYDITVRIPQDNQPIRIQERGTTVDNQFVPRGMAVNDGTRATAWGQAGNAPSYGGVASSFGNTQVRPSAGISMAGVRGTTPSTSKSLESPNFSARDGEWKSRSSYEATERR
jgi:hypothetical protein